MVRGWSALRAQCWQTVANRHQPKAKRDWFFLRERWNAYTEEMREIVLLVAKIGENKPLEKYTDTQKRAIATSISLINAFTTADTALIAREKKMWEKLYEPD